MAGVQGGIGGESGPLRRRSRLAVALIAAAWLALPATAGAAAVTEFRIRTAASIPAGITVGPDGAIWFTEENGNNIGRLALDGTLDEYPIPTPFSRPAEIAAGPDGALWFTEPGAAPLPKIGRITTAGVVTDEYELPLGSGPDGITAGPDGAIWFTLTGTRKIGRITVDGTCCDEYELVEGFLPGDITPGPDGRLWFTESEPANKVGAISMSGEIKEYDVPGTGPSGIAASGGALWFTMHHSDRIGRIPTFGLPITDFPVPAGAGPSGIALGSDGALWFTEQTAGKIGRMTTTGRITEFALPDPRSEPSGIVAGPDGAMWFTEEIGNQIGRIEAGSSTGAATSSPASLPVATPTGSTTSTQKKKKKRACRVPRLRGLPVRKARKKLRRARCRYRLSGRGRVVSTRPQAGIRTRSRVQVRARPRPR